MTASMDDFVFVESAIIKCPREENNRILMSVDREWCRRDDCQDLESLFFDEPPFDGHPKQLISIDAVRTLPKDDYLLAWQVSKSDFKKYYDGRYVFSPISQKIISQSMVLIGFDVCTYFNATVMKNGRSPFNCLFGDMSMINGYGLFSSLELARQCSAFNEVEDLGQHAWYPVAVYTDEFSLERMNDRLLNG